MVPLSHAPCQTTLRSDELAKQTLTIFENTCSIRRTRCLAPCRYRAAARSLSDHLVAAGIDRATAGEVIMSVPDSEERIGKPASSAKLSLPAVKQLAD
jgi:hypothetical protein